MNVCMCCCCIADFHRSLINLVVPALLRWKESIEPGLAQRTHTELLENAQMHKRTNIFLSTRNHTVNANMQA